MIRCQSRAWPGPGRGGVLVRVTTRDTAARARPRRAAVTEAAADGGIMISVSDLPAARRLGGAGAGESSSQ
jgi:hypothetical protein